MANHYNKGANIRINDSEMRFAMGLLRQMW
jgi:hypothetical protein